MKIMEFLKKYRLLIVLAIIVLLLCLNKKEGFEDIAKNFDKCKPDPCKEDPEFQKDCLSKKPKNLEQCKKCAECMGTTLEKARKMRTS